MFRSLFSLLRGSKKQEVIPVNKSISPVPSISSSPFSIDVPVRVKAEVKDPDNGDDISGWQGRVSKVDEESRLILIDWDSITLQAMDENYISLYEKQGLGWQKMYLGYDDVELTEARDSKQDTQEVYDQLASKHFWDEFEEGELIKQVLAHVKPKDEMGAMKAWAAYLSKTLHFPFKADASVFSVRGVVREGESVMVRKITSVDDQYGVIVSIKHKRGVAEYPLCDLTPTDERSKNHDPITAYSFWYTNR